ncbi:hypothetical protein [Streptomyces sp. NPDC001933]|uniref:hypothetical protein n=1 Tax=Streptomyces sp. NPDC001933 TaxID=3364626 RepID=UPI0036864B1B
MSTYGGWGQGEDEEEVVWQLARLLKTRAWLVGGRDDAARRSRTRSLATQRAQEPSA